MTRHSAAKDGFSSSPRSWILEQGASLVSTNEVILSCRLPVKLLHSPTQSQFWLYSSQLIVHPMGFHPPHFLQENDMIN